MSEHKIAIIGSGPAGYTAAIYTSRASIGTDVFMGLQPGGQLTTTTEIENFPGFENGIMGPELMMNMENQAKRFGAKMIQEEVQKIEKVNSSKFRITTSAGDYEYDGVIIASGASAKYLGLPNEEKWIGKGYHTCATCDGFFYRGKEIAVVGGGDSAMEEANFLTKFATKVYLIHRSDSFKASTIMLERAQNNPKIEFLTFKKVTDFVISSDNQFQGIEIEDIATSDKSKLNIDGLFVAIGHNPNSGFTSDLSLPKDDLGYLIPQSRVNPEDRISRFQTSSSIEGIFVAGDVEDNIYRQAITAAGDGCKAAMDLEKWLESKE
ncbi:MAG: thioredoxin-disulfide reductase [Patescibacteria group bacterium]